MTTAAPPEPAVHIAGLNHFFGDGDGRRQALFDINLSLQPGEVVIMTGPSGSGKTTLLVLAGALRTAQEGTLRVLGQDLRGLSAGGLVDVRRNIGFIFQFHNLFESLSALENVRMALELHPGTDRERREKATAMLSALGLGDRIHYKPANLSGGQKQRVAIARALVNQPRLILADEPTAALDKESGRVVVDLLRAHAKEHGGTIILVTHDNRILDIADKIVTLVDGRIVSSVAVKESVFITELLQKAPGFEKQTPGELTEVAQKMRPESHVAGDVLFRAGDPGDKFYLIRTGTIEAVADGPSGPDVVDTLGPGMVFGQGALLHDQPRQHTARVTTDAELYVLGKVDFRAAVDASLTLREQLLQLYASRTRSRR
ncbi:MAG: ATP-binding cassette domain-containing protein [Fimbriiglobus sp.]